MRATPWALAIGCFSHAAIGVTTPDGRRWLRDFAREIRGVKLLFRAITSSADLAGIQLRQSRTKD